MKGVAAKKGHDSRVTAMASPTVRTASAYDLAAPARFPTSLLVAADLSVEEQRHGLAQALHRARLVEECFVGPERRVLLEQLIGEPGDIEHLRLRPRLPHARDELRSA